MVPSRFYHQVRMNRRLLRHVTMHPALLPAVLRVAQGARRYAQRYFDRRSLISGPPVTVIVRVTHRCNQRCIQCGLWGRRGVLKQAEPSWLDQELTTQEMIDLVSGLAPFRPFLSFFGGEPLLRADLPQVIAHATSRHLLTTMNSNGLLLTERAEALVRAGLTYYKASLDGPPGVNERIRVCPDSFSRAFSGIEQLLGIRRALASPVPIVQLCATVTPENQYDLIRIAELADGLGVDVLAILFGIFTTEELLGATDRILLREFGIRSRYWPGFVLDRTGMDVPAIRRQIAEIKARRWRFEYRQYPADTRVFDLDVHYHRPEQAHGRGRCIVPWFRMQVMPNGDVALCEDTPDYVAGNIREQNPLEIWNGVRYQRFRQYLLEHGVFPVCTRCSALYEIPHYQNDSLPALRFPGNRYQE
jgi:radical SAM protein with 4Fe4S-binding SPASM domain